MRDRPHYRHCAIIFILHTPQEQNRWRNIQIWEVVYQTAQFTAIIGRLRKMQTTWENLKLKHRSNLRNQIYTGFCMTNKRTFQESSSIFPCSMSWRGKCCITISGKQATDITQFFLQHMILPLTIASTKHNMKFIIKCGICTSQLLSMFQHLDLTKNGLLYVDKDKAQSFF